MKINKAISLRLLDLCNEKGISANKLAELSGLSYAVIKSIINCDSANLELSTIFKICCGLNISMSEFFNDDKFKSIGYDIFNS